MRRSLVRSLARSLQRFALSPSGLAMNTSVRRFCKRLRTLKLRAWVCRRTDDRDEEVEVGLSARLHCQSSSSSLRRIEKEERQWIGAPARWCVEVYETVAHAQMRR